jgi:LysR family transcriptional regulator, transcriptional activator of nhaA
MRSVPASTSCLRWLPKWTTWPCLMAREAIGLAPLPAIVVRDELDAGSLCEVVRLQGIEETFYALTFQRQFQSQVAEELIAAASHWPA